MQTARVIEERKTNYIISNQAGEFVATVRGSFFDTDNFPKVGDNVEFTTTGLDKAVIEKILPRTSAIIRAAAQTKKPQVIVANVDFIFIVMGLDNDFNTSRLERYLLAAKQSEIASVVVLNKADSADKPEEYISKARAVSGTSPVHAVSALTGANMDTLLPYLLPNNTIVLLGSSGAGKSTMTNWLLREEKQAVQNVRERDSRGRHTTTSRQLFSLPCGGYLIDTPGMRELSIINSTAEDENRVFDTINQLARNCQFSNCDHEKSQGCAVLPEIENGNLPERQFQNYQKIQKERLSSTKYRNTK